MIPLRSILMVLILALSACLVASSLAAGPAAKLPATTLAPSAATTSGLSNAGKSVTDTLYLLGGPHRGDGKFQRDEFPSVPDDEGWLSWADWAEIIWHVDTFNAELLDPTQDPNHAMWCGRTFAPCATEVEGFGYGNSYNVAIEWSGAVSNPDFTTVVSLTARLNYETEPGYDYLYVEIQKPEGWETINYYNGSNRGPQGFEPVDVDLQYAMLPEELVGEDGDQVHLRWRFISDGAFSDEDCLWPTDGAAQVDNIAVFFDQGDGPVQQIYDDFEPGNPVNWEASFASCGFGQVWADLPDAGLCKSNRSPGLAFVDDGSTCAESDGTPGGLWTYGPGGFITHCPVWLQFEEDQMWSPVLDLPADVDDYDGARLEFDVYRHGSEAPGGPFYNFFMRSSSDGGINWSSWDANRFVYEMHDPSYVRNSFPVHHLVPQGANRVQIALGFLYFRQFGFPDCSEVTPAPYFDNVALKIFKHTGPFLYTNLHDGVGVLARDNFPASGQLDLLNLASNSVPIGSSSGLPPQVQAAPRPDATMDGPPELHWVLRANPLFDPNRTAMVPNPVLGDSIGTPHPADVRKGIEYSFIFPDSGFFFPGDELHYYFVARDDRGGEIGISYLPADTTGFSTFPGDPGYVLGLYPREYEVRALPSLHDAGGNQPAILLWQDYEGGAGDNEWNSALANLGYQRGVDFDIYRQRLPGNALPATAVQLAGYQTLLYDCDRSLRNTLTDQDAERLQTWIDWGGKNLLLMGEDLAADLSSANTVSFLRYYLGINPVATGDIQPFIDNQNIPLVVPVAGNPVGLTASYLANACREYSDFDELATFDTGQWLCKYTAPGGGPGNYEYAAGIYNYRADLDAHFITLPYGMARMEHPNGSAGRSLSARTQLLSEILTFYGHSGSGTPSDVPATQVLSMRTYPNPFNPRAQIEYTMPRSGRLTVRIYNVRGQRVRTLLDESVPAGAGHLIWDGTDDTERAVAAGVYFCELRALDEVRIQKMALLK